MLTWFRDNAKIFLVAVVVIFVAMIFLQWGRGGVQSVEVSELIVGKVNGTDLTPEAFDAAHQKVYSALLEQMRRTGDPNPEDQLSLMYNDISNTAFNFLVDEELQDEYLRKLGWSKVTPSLAEPLLKTQLTLAGIEDPETYIQDYRDDPNYAMTLNQLVSTADMTLFGAAVSLENMASVDEVRFFLNDAMTTVTARYVEFRSNPSLPSEEELKDFYDANTDLFVSAPGSRVRYATFSVIPSDEDVQATLAFVDSMALAGAGNSDTLTTTREQLNTVAGWNIDLDLGTLSQPFTGPSILQPSRTACHSVELLSVTAAEGDSTGAGDTLTLVHWEVPLTPGLNTVRTSLWALEDRTGEILSDEFPSYDSLPLLDYGEMIIDTSTQPTEKIPQSLVSFATDSMLSDSLEPIFYLPATSTGYPAFVVAKILERIPGRQLSYQEALDNNSILVKMYTQRQQEESLAKAEHSLASIQSSGETLREWAAADSIQVHTTQEFTPSSVRQWSDSEQAAYRGLLGCRDFAEAALLAPEYTVLGPYSNNGVAYLAEIVSRNEQQLPDDASLLTFFYLSAENSHNQTYAQRLMNALRDSSDIQDLREQYYSKLDSLRAGYLTTR